MKNIITLLDPETYGLNRSAVVLLTIVGTVAFWVMGQCASLIQEAQAASGLPLGQ